MLLFSFCYQIELVCHCVMSLHFTVCLLSSLLQSSNSKGLVYELVYECVRVCVSLYSSSSSCQINRDNTIFMSSQNGNEPHGEQSERGFGHAVVMSNLRNKISTTLLKERYILKPRRSTTAHKMLS